jgi:hypothetical protein
MIITVSGRLSCHTKWRKDRFKPMSDRTWSISNVYTYLLRKPYEYYNYHWILQLKALNGLVDLKNGSNQELDLGSQKWQALNPINCTTLITQSHNPFTIPICVQDGECRCLHYSFWGKNSFGQDEIYFHDCVDTLLPSYIVRSFYLPIQHADMSAPPDSLGH